MDRSIQLPPFGLVKLDEQLDASEAQQIASLARCWAAAAAFMECRQIVGEDRARTGQSHPMPEVEILAVENEALVEPTDVVECSNVHRQ